ADQGGGNPLAEEHPLPAVQSQHSVKLEEGGGQWRANGGGERNPDQEPGHHPAAMVLGEPAVEIEQHTGEESGLGYAEQDADGEKAPRADGEGGRRGQEAPTDHD